MRLRTGILGSRGIGELMERNVARASRFAEMVLARPELGVLVDPQTNIVNYRALPSALWPIRRVALGDEELTGPRDTSTVDERIALVA